MQMLDVAVPQRGVRVFHAGLIRGAVDGRVTRVFVSSHARWANPRVVMYIGSTAGV